MDRTVVKRTTLDQQGLDSGVPDATPAERLLMVWPLTLTAWAFKEPNIVQPRLQRHVVRTIRHLWVRPNAVNKRTSGRPEDIADVLTLDQAGS